jgi:uncharacterized membrane protein YphA (DoxX/SURF4 family)
VSTAVPKPMTRMKETLAIAVRARPPHGSATTRWALALRWAPAVIFVVFGVGKFINHASEVSSFSSYGLPAPDAFVYAIGALEIVGGLLLASGLFVIPAAIALAGDMVGAIVLSCIGRGENVSLTLAPALLLAMILLILLEVRREPGDEA